jgi:hypothetical protein
MLNGIYAVSIMLSVAYKPIMLTVIILTVIMLTVATLTVVMLTVVMLTVIKLTVVMLSVMAPLGRNKLVCLALKKHPR